MCTTLSLAADIGKGLSDAQASVSEVTNDVAQSTPASQSPAEVLRSVGRLEQLAESDPGRYTGRLAWALTRLADSHFEAGRYDACLETYQQAAELIRARVDAGVATAEEEAELPQHVGNVASVAARLGRHDFARGAAEEAILRELALGATPRAAHSNHEAFLADMRALLDATP